MPGITEKKLNKRNRILDSAYELFRNSSFNSTAIDDVVKAAGVAKGTFYLYFKDKYDLLDQLVIDKSSGIIISAFKDAFSDESLSFSEKINLFADNIIDELNSHKEIAALLQKNLSRWFVSVRDSVDEELRNVITEIKNGMCENGFTEDEAYKAMYLITDLTGSVCFDAIVRGQPFTLDEIRPMLHRAISSVLEGGECKKDAE